MNRASFFAEIRPLLFNGSLSAKQVKVMDLILDEANKNKLTIAETAYVFATVLHEVGGDLQPKSESLTYSSAKRIQSVWPSRFPTLASAQPYVRQPRKLANKVYGGRMGNNTDQDGWNYRGRGLVQITGKNMYAKMGVLLGIDLVKNPDLANDVSVAVQILIIGMIRGIFRTHKLSDFVTKDGYDYVNARGIINADVEKNGESISKKARSFERALRVGKPVEFIANKAIVMQVQKDLQRLNYPEVGEADGKPGDMTAAAVLLYRRNKGLPITDKIDEELVKTLQADKEPRQFVEARANATPAEVAEKTLVVKENAQGEWFAKLITFITGVPTILYGALLEIPAAKTLLEPIKEGLQATPGWVWPVLVVAVAGASWYTHRRAKTTGTTLYNQGHIR